MIPAVFLRPTVALGALLAISAACNVWQFHRAAYKAGQEQAQDKLAAVQSQLASANKSIAVSEALAEQSREDHAALLAVLDDIAMRGQQTRTIYRAVAAKAPLAVDCAPGQDRVDAVNAGLGGVK